jgi:hypothetical protein
MMSLQSLLNHLEGLVRDEIEGKKRLLALLLRQESAVLEHKRVELDETTRAIEKELSLEVGRAGRRERIFAGLAAHWGVAPGTLTLASIAERAERGRKLERTESAGHQTGTLSVLRAEMRDLLANVLRQNRRVSRLVSEHRRLVADTLTLLLGDGESGGADGGMLEGSGSLVDAEA